MNKKLKQWLKNMKMKEKVDIISNLGPIAVRREPTVSREVKREPTASLEKAVRFVRSIHPNTQTLIK